MKARLADVFVAKEEPERLLRWGGALGALESETEKLMSGGNGEMWLRDCTTAVTGTTGR